MGGVAATFWALSNVHVETDGQSYDQHVARAVLTSAEREKRSMHRKQRFAKHCFTLSFCDYGEVIWVQTGLSFSILQAISDCMHKSRVKWRKGICMENGVTAMH